MNIGDFIFIFKNNFMEIANDITSLVGNTPLVKLNRIRKYFDCKINSPINIIIVFKDLLYNFLKRI